MNNILKFFWAIDQQKIMWRVKKILLVTHVTIITNIAVPYTSDGCCTEFNIYYFKLSLF